ncbi:MAG: hypothetical protein KF874_10320 [Rhizobiaceae bacterium]|nr:hypothetical protein [Rhizobiaceae bacterium]
MRRLSLLVLMLATPASAEPTIWTGESIALRASEQGVICPAGKLVISVENSIIKAKHEATGADLNGKIGPENKVSMAGRKGAYVFSFTGTIEKDLIKGSWIEAGSRCGGTWHAKLQPETPSN